MLSLLFILIKDVFSLAAKLELNVQFSAGTYLVQSYVVGLNGCCTRLLFYTRLLFCCKLCKRMRAQKIARSVKFPVLMSHAWCT